MFLFSLVRVKTFFKEMCRRKCDFVSYKISNFSIAASSFHFGGYFTGYLLWGFLIIYLFGVFIGIGIVFIRIFIGDKTFAKIALRLVPVITVLVYKKISNFISTRFIFLKRDTKVLALENFRAFNIFLFFNFYYDCFMGVISAIVRLIKALLLAILMMPSKIKFLIHFNVNNYFMNLKF